MIIIQDTLTDKPKTKKTYRDLNDFLSSQDWTHREKLLLQDSLTMGSAVEASPQIYGLKMIESPK